jgi:hypothetical protein
VPANGAMHLKLSEQLEAHGTKETQIGLLLLAVHIFQMAYVYVDLFNIYPIRI